MSWILRENLVFDDELMQVVSQKVSTSVTTMSIKNSEEATLRPICYIFFCWRLHDVKNDTYSVFVIVTDYPLISVRSITHYMTVFPHATFGRFPARQI